MSFISFFKKDPLKKKILSIKKDIKAEVSKVCKENFWIDWYGAYNIHPKHLVFWICVKSDNSKIQLQADKTLNEKLRKLLKMHDYPAEVRDEVHIGFESQETVDRESNGSWYIHTK